MRGASGGPTKANGSDEISRCNEEERGMHELELLGSVGVKGGGRKMEMKARGLGGARDFCRTLVIYNRRKHSIR